MATRYANAMETDSGRGEYIDPKAGQVRFAEVAARWLPTRIVDPNTAIKYEASLRLHVNPVFGRRQLSSIKPSEIASWVADLGARFGPGTARNAFIVLHGPLELAVDDGTIKRNPAKARAVKVPIPKGEKAVVWSDKTVLRIVEEHPVQYRPIPILDAAAGLRQGEMFGLAEEDIDFDEMVIHVRRQVKKLGKYFVFALPKSDKERTVPLSEGAAQTLRAHIEATEPRPYTLPWEQIDGPPLTVKILFRWRDDRHIRARSYDEYVWKPALSRAGVTPMPTRNPRGELQYLTNRDTGLHAPRHYYASVSLADGVNIKELAEYLGYVDPGFTLHLYTHLLPSSHERSRKAIDNRPGPLFSMTADGTATESGHQAPSGFAGAGPANSRPDRPSKWPLTCGDTQGRSAAPADSRCRVGERRQDDQILGQLATPATSTCHTSERTDRSGHTIERVATPNPRRPIMPGNKLFESLPGAADPAAVTEVAHRTAELLVRGVRSSEDTEVHARVVKLADDYGLDELAELWSDAPADSLPGSLWRLYLLRSWVHTNAEAVSREFAAGRKYAEVHAVVAGVAEPPGPTEVRDMVDAVLRGVATGDFATTLDRAAAFARIVATGRAHLADDGHDQVLSASKLVEMADQLQTAARAERAGQLW